MRHRKAGLKLGRTSSHRKALFRNMVTSLLKHDRIRTTDTKAKEIRRWADHIITLAKRGDLHARRQALSIVREKAVVKKIFDEVEKRFGNRTGGYTRVVKLGYRAGDAAPVSIVELVGYEKELKKKDKKKKDKAQTEPVQPVVEKTEETESAAPVAAEPAAESSETQEAVAETQEEAPESAEAGVSEESDVSGEEKPADPDEKKEK